MSVFAAKLKSERFPRTTMFIYYTALNWHTFMFLLEYNDNCAGLNLAKSVIQYYYIDQLNAVNRPLAPPTPLVNVCKIHQVKHLTNFGAFHQTSRSACFKN